LRVIALNKLAGEETLKGAIDLYSRADVIFKKYGDLLTEATCIINRANALNKLGGDDNLKQALQDTEKALQQMDVIRCNLLLESSRQHFQEDLMMGPYRRGCQWVLMLAMQQGQLDVTRAKEAYRLGPGSKAMTFRESMDSNLLSAILAVQAFPNEKAD
jgi:hypothetical protein